MQRTVTKFNAYILETEGCLQNLIVLQKSACTFYQIELLPYLTWSVTLTLQDTVQTLSK